jgi:hypothetical protein
MGAENSEGTRRGKAPRSRGERLGAVIDAVGIVVALAASAAWVTFLVFLVYRLLS